MSIELRWLDLQLWVLLAGLAGTLLASRLSNAVLSGGYWNGAKSNHSCILGGASLSGGLGTVPGAFLGVLFMALIQNVLIISQSSCFLAEYYCRNRSSGCNWD